MPKVFSAQGGKIGDFRAYATFTTHRHWPRERPAALSHDRFKPSFTETALQVNGIGWVASGIVRCSCSRSMRMLLMAGADRAVTTLVDDDLTAEEEARSLGHLKSADFIANFSSD